ncbi:MAG: hypothetical protein GX853_06605 [Chloroflexi bacterium]|nr:hypothetical protein [Chloroflexota bacterium]
MLSTGNFMRPPDDEQVYEIGDRVEVNCDHEDKDGQRIRGWVRGTVVQIENKLVAVQFKDKIYLTDGWMVPDHILWFPFDSENVRPWVSPQSRARKKG